MWLEWLPGFRQSYAYAALLIILLALRALVAFSRKATVETLVGSALLSIVIAIQGFSSAAIINAGGAEDFLQTIAFTAIIAPLMWLIGDALGESWGVPKRMRFLRIVLWMSLVGCGSAVFTGIAQGYSRYGSPVFFFLRYDNGIRSFYNYLALADTIAILATLTLNLHRNYYLRVAIFIVSSVLLVFANSRASLFFFVFVGLLSLWKQVKRRGVVTWLLSAMVVLAGVIALAIFLERRTEDALFTRMALLVTSPSQDESFLGRLAALSDGLVSLEEHWLLGEFMSEWWDTGETGTYMHNWLSFWLAFGFIPFLIFICLSVLCTRKIIGQRFPSPEAPTYLYILCILCILLAKAYVWPFIWLALGLTSSLKIGNNINENRISSSLQQGDEQWSSQKD